MSIRRKLFSPFVLTVTILGLSSPILSSILPSVSKDNDADSHFKAFSQNLLVHSDLDEFSVEKGAAISSPFGVGYMLANINERVWNVSNEGVDKVLKTTKVAEDYEALIQRMEKAGISVSSTLFTRDPNVSQKVPEGSRRMKTETRLVDFIDDWKTTWLTMNARVSNQTEGVLDDQLIPKGGWWGGAFYYFTMGAFINTNHFKGDWDKEWKSMDSKKFYDGFSVPFVETEGNFPFLESQNYSAVSIKLKDPRKSVVLVLPKVPLVPFLLSDMPQLVRSIPTTWELKAKKVQIPELNITLLDQHYKKLEALGLNYTFCVDEPDSHDIASKKGPFFMAPIVQSHHITISPKYFRVASATGSSLNSEEIMRNQGVFHVPAEGKEGEDPSDDEDTRSEFVLPMEMDAKLIKALAEGELELKGVDVMVENEGKNETIGSASSLEEVSVPPEQKNVKPDSNEVSTSTSTIPPTPESTTTTTAIPFAPETLPEGTIRFDQPFFWYLWDSEMGPLYYGAVHSLATYQKEYGIETEEDLWLYDAYKTLLWNCP